MNSIMVYKRATCVVLLTIMLTVCGYDMQWEVLTTSDGIHAVAYSDVYFYDGQVGVAAAVGEVHRTTDSGRTWSRASIPEILTVYSFNFYNDRLWGIGASPNMPSLIYSDDKGESWQKAVILSSVGLPWNSEFTTFYDARIDENGSLWLTGDAGLLRGRIEDTTINLVSVVRTDRPLYSIAKLPGDQENIVAVGGGRAVFAKVDDERLESIDSVDSLYRVKVFAEVIWIVGTRAEQGVLLRSVDRGRTWQEAGPRTAPPLYDIHFSDGQGILIGDRGAIFYTSDNGNSWIARSSFTENALQRIFCLETNDCWISGDRLTVRKARTGN